MSSGRDSPQVHVGIELVPQRSHRCNDTTETLVQWWRKTAHTRADETKPEQKVRHIKRFFWWELHEVSRGLAALAVPTRSVPVCPCHRRLNPPCSAPSRQHSGSISGCRGSTSTLMDTLFPAHTEPTPTKKRYPLVADVRRWPARTLSHTLTHTLTDYIQYRWRSASWCPTGWVSLAPGPMSCRRSRPGCPRTWWGTPGQAGTGCRAAPESSDDKRKQDRTWETRRQLRRFSRSRFVDSGSLNPELRPQTEPFSWWPCQQEKASDKMCIGPVPLIILEPLQRATGYE